jgi:hypothetical protein
MSENTKITAIGDPSPKKSRKPLYLGIAVIAVLLLGAAAFLLSRSSAPAKKPVPSAESTQTITVNGVVLTYNGGPGDSNPDYLDSTTEWSPMLAHSMSQPLDSEAYAKLNPQFQLDMLAIYTVNGDFVYAGKNTNSLPVDASKLSSDLAIFNQSAASRRANLAAASKEILRFLQSKNISDFKFDSGSFVNGISLSSTGTTGLTVTGSYGFSGTGTYQGQAIPLTYGFDLTTDSQGTLTGITDKEFTTPSGTVQE